MKYFPLLLLLLVGACKATTDTSNPAPTDTRFGTGLTFNTAAEIEDIAEAEFDDSLFYDPKGGRMVGGRLMGRSTLPASFSLNGPPIIQQGNTGKCGPFSSAYFIIGMYNGVTGAAQNFDKVGSTDFAYSQYKKLANDPCGGEGGVLLFKNGTRPGFADILQQYGTCSWNQLPFRETNDCSVITEQMITQAAANKIEGYRRIDKTDYSNPTDLKSFLYGGFPLWFGVAVDDGFQNIGTGVWKSASGKNHGGHAMTIVGWDDNKQAFKIANSWGSDWADKGYGWVDYTYFAKLLTEMGGNIMVMYPSDAQLPIFSELSPGSCGKANWGDLIVANKRSEQVSVEITGANNYTNTKTNPTEAEEEQTYSGIPAGAITVKVFNVGKTTLLKTYNVTITKCRHTTVTVD
jgi:hypothetical protein